MNIWESTMDERFKCLVERVDRYTGHLSVTDTTTGNTILSKDVPLAYGAQFGPDVGDVAMWQDEAVKIVDKYLEGVPSKGNRGPT